LRSGNWIDTLRQQNFEISPFSQLSTVLPYSLPKLALCFHSAVLIFFDFVPCRYKGWYGGYQVGYNTSTAKLTANNIAAGYQGTDFTVHPSP